MGLKMNDVQDYISTKGLSAAELNHALKTMGNGDMREGVTCMVETAEEDGMKKGGIIGGLIVLAVGGIIYGAKEIYFWNKAHVEKKQKIQTAFEIASEQQSDDIVVNDELGEESV